MGTWETLCKRYNNYRDTIVLLGTKTYVLTGLVESEYDYYWELSDFFGKKTSLSCVGEPIWLIDYLSLEDYSFVHSQFIIYDVIGSSTEPSRKR